MVRVRQLRALRGSRQTGARGGVWVDEGKILLQRRKTRVHGCTVQPEPQRKPIRTLLVAPFLSDLEGAGEVVTDPGVLESFRRDQAGRGLLEAGMPAAMARPRTTAEVQAAVGAAARHG